MHTKTRKLLKAMIIYVARLRHIGRNKRLHRNAGVIHDPRQEKDDKVLLYLDRCPGIPCLAGGMHLGACSNISCM